MNTDAIDTLTISIIQHDGETVLSELTLKYPNLPNAEANMMQLGIVDAIRLKTMEWSGLKASGKPIS